MSPGYISRGGGGGGSTGPASSILSGAIGSGTINGQFQILSGTVYRTNIQDNAVGSGQIGSGQIAGVHIASGALVSGNYASGSISPFILATNSFVPLDYICITDQKATNTAGGIFTQAAWQQRDLNTELADTGGYASVAGNQFTLNPGTYRIRATVPAYNVLRHKAKLFHATSGDIVVGSSEYANGTETRSVVAGRFTVPVAMTYQIRHICAQTQNPDGFGVASNFSGYSEVYTVIELWREGP